MLSYILAAMLSVSPANVEEAPITAWKAADNLGGKLVFTKHPCAEESIGGSMIGMLAPSGEFYAGCWRESTDKKEIHIFRKVSKEHDYFHLMKFDKQSIRFECNKFPCSTPYEGAKLQGLDI